MKIPASITLDKGHIILAAVVALSLAAGLWSWQGRAIDAAERKAAIATEDASRAKEAATTSARENRAFQERIEDQLADLARQNQALIATNATVTRALAQRDRELAVQKEINAKSTPTEQSQRWELLVPEAIVSPIDTGFEINAAGGLATLQSLESVPVLEAKVTDLQANIVRLETVVENGATALAAEQSAHAADLTNSGVQLDAAQKETAKVQAEFDVHKKKSRRNILKSIVGGFAGGVVFAIKFGL